MTEVEFSFWVGFGAGIGALSFLLAVVRAARGKL